MFNCKNLVHPFQNDTGCSQSQRDMDELLSGAAKIDGRSLVDLLNYFTEFSSNVKYTAAYYNETEKRTILTDDGNWQAFFKKSIPFILAAAAKDKAVTLTEKFQLYTQFFNKNPSVRALQLLIHFVYYNTIYKINNLNKGISNSNLPLVADLQNLTTNKLQEPVKNFIRLTYSASKLLCIKYIEFEPVYTSSLWNIKRNDDVINGDIDINKIAGRHEQLIALYNALSSSFTALLQGMNVIANAAASNIQQSLLPLQDDLRQRHTPHLALVFTFLNLFSKLQNDLNGYTKKHLDFFYQDVLRLKPKDAQPDEVHLVFELQKQLKQYILKKGLQAKAAKDSNNAEIDFALADDIVVNKTQVTDLRTLFLNNEAAGDKDVYVEGAYMAVKANTADGIDKDFKDDVKNYPTLGAKYSKYIAPDTGFLQPYPNARLGFMLASPVLFLQEGLRTITINLSCKLKNNCQPKTISTIQSKDPCCNTAPDLSEINQGKFPDFIEPDKLYNAVEQVLTGTFIYITENLLLEAKKKGIQQDIIDNIRDHYLIDKCRTSVCCTGKIFYKQYATHHWSAMFWTTFTSDQNAQNILSALFPPRKPLQVLFSGEKEWITPVFDTTAHDLKVTFLHQPEDKDTFTITIVAIIRPDKPAITFYNKENLKEDINTTQPLVKIQLDDNIKIPLTKKLQSALELDNTADACCLDKEFDLCDKEISLYHFLRDVIITDTTINVTVCGLKNLIVQNDENVQNVNSLIYPFGTRPKITANFYVGSKEIFSKNWQELWINAEWKDRPEDFKAHYEYYGFQVFEDKTAIIDESSFKVKSAVLENGQWKPNGKKRLFKDPGELQAPFCTHSKLLYNQDVYHYVTTDFPKHTYLPKQLNTIQLVPLNVSSQYGFLRLTLEGVSFQHDRYTFVLARYMMALANLSDPVTIIEARAISDAILKTTLPDISTEIGKIKTNIDQIITKVNDIVSLLTSTSTPLGIRKLITQLISSLSAIDLSSVITDLGTIKNNLEAAIAALSKPSPTPQDITDALNSITAAIPIINSLVDSNGPITTVSNEILNISGVAHEIQSGVDAIINDITKGKTSIQSAINHIQTSLTNLGDVSNGLINKLIQQVTDIRNRLTPNEALQIGTPPEPYTPLIKGFSIDYSAKADMNDIDLIHLYPYQNTYKQEELRLQPTLLPTFCDEGTLFIGLSDLIPGENVNILFQLAEATSDSEADTQIVYWSYLYNNEWLSLRKGFEILDDATDNLTISGIIKFALPQNMSADNTVMPKGVYWIKAAVPKNSKAVCETLGIYTQAIKATFIIDPANDTSRLSQPLAANAISKLKVADANIKQVTQPSPSFNGREPEATRHYYTRVSELLRHKGRAIQKFDYERLTLEAFPQVFKAKCINHSFKMDADKYYNDFPFAPGYVLVAVIPDLTKLLAGQSFEPKIPTGLLEEIQTYLTARSSPFVKIKAVNPRYEKIDFCISVILTAGYDKNFYKEKLAQDIREFLAPWAVGKYDKLTFGECVNKSDIVHFLETRDYVDYITKMQMQSEMSSGAPSDTVFEICPATPRSVLLAGEIQICIEDNDENVWEAIDCNNITPVVDYCKPVKTVLV